jgi:hypothetical protein
MAAMRGQHVRDQHQRAVVSPIVLHRAERKAGVKVRGAPTGRARRVRAYERNNAQRV